jgi:AAA+ ATPase superfamily predicted ATPase
MEETAMKSSTVPSNPFTTSVAGGPDFCDRTEELAGLERLVRDGQSIVLSSPRRYGKTSLVLHLQERLREKEFLTVYVDFFSVLSEQDFVTKLARAVVAGIARGASPDIGTGNIAFCRTRRCHGKPLQLRGEE